MGEETDDLSARKQKAIKDAESAKNNMDEITVFISSNFPSYLADLKLMHQKELKILSDATKDVINSNSEDELKLARDLNYLDFVCEYLNIQYNPFEKAIEQTLYKIGEMKQCLTESKKQLTKDDAGKIDSLILQLSNQENQISLNLKNDQRVQLIALNALIKKTETESEAILNKPISSYLAFIKPPSLQETVQSVSDTAEGIQKAVSAPLKKLYQYGQKVVGSNTVRTNDDLDTLAIKLSLIANSIENQVLKEKANNLIREFKKDREKTDNTSDKIVILYDKTASKIKQIDICDIKTPYDEAIKTKELLDQAVLKESKMDKKYELQSLSDVLKSALEAAAVTHGEKRLTKQISQAVDRAAEKANEALSSGFEVRRRNWFK